MIKLRAPVEDKDLPDAQNFDIPVDFVSERLVLLGDNLGTSTHAVKMDASLDISVLIGRLYWTIVQHAIRVFFMLNRWSYQLDVNSDDSTKISR